MNISLFLFINGCSLSFCLSFVWCRHAACITRYTPPHRWWFPFHIVSPHHRHYIPPRLAYASNTALEIVRVAST